MTNKQYWILCGAAFKRKILSHEERVVVSEIYSKEGREKIYEISKKKKIVPAMASLLTRLNLDRGFWMPISDEYRQRNEQVIVGMNEAYTALENAGVSHMCVVENFGALLHSESDPAVFGSGDADNYADMSEKDKIYDVFRKLGYRIEECKVGEALVSSSFLGGASLPDKFYLGINWNVINRTQLPCDVCNGPFIDWSKTRYYKDTRIKLPSAENLMYVCLMHISVHRFCMAPDVRLYYDIVNAAEKPLDWDKICQYAKRDNTELKIAVGATLAYRMLGVDIPSSVRLLGKGSRRKRLLNLVSKEEENALYEMPGRIRTLFIDICSNDFGVFSGFREVFIPKGEWIKKKYGSLFIGRIKHILSLL